MDNKRVFRRDRNIKGGEVLIAVPDLLKPKLVDLSIFREEVIQTLPISCWSTKYL